MARSSFRLPRLAGQWLSGAGLICALSAGCANPQIAKTDPASPFAGGPPSHTPQTVNHTDAAAQAVAASAAAASNPATSAQLHMTYGQLQEQRGEMATARLSYEKALQLSPAMVEARVGLARVEIAAGRPQMAEHQLRQAVELQPKSAFALAAMGQFLGEQGNWAESLEYYNRAINAEPDDKRYSFQLAVALTKCGRIDQAMPFYNRSVGEAAGHHNVAVILQEQGDLAGAERHARMALARDPKLVQAQELLATLGTPSNHPRQSAQAGPTIRPATSGGVVENVASAERYTIQQTSATAPMIRGEANSGSLRITPGKAGGQLEQTGRAERVTPASNWTAPVPEPHEPEWQRMPVAPRNPLGDRPVTVAPPATADSFVQMTTASQASAGAPPKGTPQWEQWQNQTSSSSLH